MLKQRVITALILLGVLLAALFAPALWPFALLSLLLVATAAWEWGRLNGLKEGAALALGGGVVLACTSTWIAGGATQNLPALWWMASALWVVGGAAVLRLGPLGWPRLALALRLAIGIAVLWLTWLALTQARGLGLNFLLSVFSLVWAADIAAYFGGRAFGRRKLAPSISPGKSWAGVYSGMAGVLVLALLWLQVDQRAAVDAPSLYGRLAEQAGPLGLVLGCLFLAAMSVVGDLFESLVKRAVGAKDSSALLPGHGGVLDRIDALLPVFPLALAFSLL